jgi:hypothetical protein
MGSQRLSRRVEKVVAYPPLSEMSEGQRRELQEALLEADAFEDLPGSGRQRSSRPSRVGRSCGCFETSSGWWGWGARLSGRLDFSARAGAEEVPRL